MFGTNNSTQTLASEIIRLCDTYYNPKRSNQDYYKLLQLLQESPKDCIPLKGRILQHVNINSMGNQAVDLRILSSILARATILFRGSENKSDGPTGAWKSGLLNELNGLEDNISKLYDIVGIKHSKVISQVQQSSEEPSQNATDIQIADNPDYESLISNYVHHTNVHVHNICALVNLVTNFELPVPALIIVRLANKIISLRCKDLKKLPKGSVRHSVYRQTDRLIDIGLMLVTSLMNVLRTDMLAFQPIINQSLLRLLEWTRTSGLADHDSVAYESIRAKVFRLIQFALEEYSVNFNLSPDSLKNLIEVEIIEQSRSTESLECLEAILFAYSNYLDVKLEAKIHKLVLDTCLESYRNGTETSKPVILRMLEAIMSQPCSTSASEVGANVLELALRFESDPQIRRVAKRALSLANRPVIVSYDDLILPERPLAIENTNSTTIEESTIEARVIESPAIEEPSMELTVKEAPSISQNGDSTEKDCPMEEPDKHEAPPMNGCPVNGKTDDMATKEQPASNGRAKASIVNEEEEEEEDDIMKLLKED